MFVSARRPALDASLPWARRRRCPFASSLATLGLVWGLAASGCDTPHTYVVFENDYPASPTRPVVYRAAWQAITLDEGGIEPGESSDPQSTIAASENLAYVVLAPGWDPAIGTMPTSFVVLQSRQGFAVHLNNTLHIPIDDATFMGNCAAGSFLTQAQADFITQLVFPGDFANVRYDAATCSTSLLGDARAP